MRRNMAALPAWVGAIAMEDKVKVNIEHARLEALGKPQLKAHSGASDSHVARDTKGVLYLAAQLY